MNTGQSKVKFARGRRRFLKGSLGELHFQALTYFLDAFRRILPHTQIGAWEKDLNPATPGARWTGSSRRELRIRLLLRGTGIEDIALTTTLKRRVVLPLREIPRTLDTREQDICNCIVKVLHEFWNRVTDNSTEHVVEALVRAFDQAAISKHIVARHQFSPAELFSSLRKLSERSYEGKSIPLGILVETNRYVKRKAKTGSLEDYLNDKKYHVLTDGYDTAYLLDLEGEISEIVDLDRLSKKESDRGRRFYPEWSRRMALSCRGTRIGFSLTRQGDILYFDDGNLRITYRAGRWQYWNHVHVLDILLHATPAQRVLPRKRARILRQVYKRALDLSFRRTGGLCILLRSRGWLHNIVRRGDAIGDRKRRKLDEALDMFLRNQSILRVPPHVLVDLASVDGAVVFANSGQLLAYGAVLDPKRKGSRILQGQGSRTKAAIAASHYGLATKVSSDGDISFYSKGKELLSI